MDTCEVEIGVAAKARSDLSSLFRIPSKSYSRLVLCGIRVWPWYVADGVWSCAGGRTHFWPGLNWQVVEEAARKFIDTIVYVLETLSAA
jgi:hypothetical protein